MMEIGQNPSFSVSEFVAIFNQTLEFAYPLVSITGEVANYRLSKNRWVYFDLKDDTSSIKCFSSITSMASPIENGLTIEVIGRPRLHNLYGFSINVDRFRAVGEGSIKKAQDLLKIKLQKEGLFDESRKRTLPYPPLSVAVVTSVESAAIGDFMKIIQMRWPVLEIDIIDTPVQGVGAAAKIAGAIIECNSRSDTPEVLIVIRGGGSVDDLAAYSDEMVVRAVASSRIPTLVAIGHERDISLAELVADVRASTPSNAAEILTPSLDHEKQVIVAAASTFDGLLQEKLKQVAEINNFFKDSIKSALSTKIFSEKTLLSQNTQLLSALDPKNPLQKGYALVRDSNEKIIKSANNVSVGNAIKIQFKSSSLKAKITQKNQGKAKS